MFILVILRLTVAGFSFETRLKVRISVGDVTVSAIGRLLWPHLFASMTCSAVHIYDKDVGDYVDVRDPEALIVQPKNKICFDFVKSDANSVICLPALYTICGTSEGIALVVDKSTGETLVEAAQVPTLKRKQQDTRHFDISKVKKEASVLPEPVDGPFPQPCSPQPAPRLRKQRRLTSPTEQSSRTTKKPAMDHNSEIGGGGDQVEEPECRKQLRQNRSAFPVRMNLPAQSNRNPWLDLIAADESNLIAAKSGKKLVEVKQEVCVSSEEEGEPIAVSPTLQELESDTEQESKYVAEELQSEQSGESDTEAPEHEIDSDSDSDGQQSGQEADLGSGKRQSGQEDESDEEDERTEQADESIAKDDESEPESVPEQRVKQEIESDSDKEQLLNARVRKCGSYSHVLFPNPSQEIRQYASNMGMDSKILFGRLHRCRGVPDSKLVEILSTVIARWLNKKAPGHSMNFRRAVIQDFLFDLFSMHNFNMEEFTNASCSGTVDKQVAQSEPLLCGERLAHFNFWKTLRPAQVMDATFYTSSTAYRDQLIHRIKSDIFELDELFFQYPYFLRKPRFLEQELLRTQGNNVSCAVFIDKWKNFFVPQIEKHFKAERRDLPGSLFPTDIYDRQTLTEFVKLFSLIKSRYLPITVIQDFIIFMQGKSDEEIIRQVRTERALRHPVIIADKDGYRLFVGNQSIFRRTKLFLEALAVYIIVSHLLWIPTVYRFSHLCYVLNRMYGFEAHDIRRSQPGIDLFRKLQDGMPADSE